MNLLKKIAISAMILFIAYKTAHAQRKNIKDQHLLWFRYYNKLSINDKWQINSEIEERTYFNPWKQHQFLVRTKVFYKLNSKVSFAPGFTYFLQSPQDPYSLSKFVTPELRPHQEVNIQNELSKKFKLSHRYELEERFLHKTRGDKLVSGFNFNFRFRYRIQIQYPIIKVKDDKKIKLVLSDEIMFNFGKNIVNNSFDQNRITVGLLYEFSKEFGLEMDYVNWFQERSSGKDYYNRNIGRITIFQNLNINQKRYKEDESIKRNR